MVPRPQPGRRYTKKQMKAMRRAYPNYVIPGHVMRLDADGMFSIVPDAQAAGAHGHGRALDTAYRSKDPVRDLFPQTPIKKRTPQERLDSLTERITKEVREGRIPGLSDEQVADIVGRSWKAGTPVTAETVRAFAAGLLEEAERKAK